MAAVLVPPGDSSDAVVDVVAGLVVVFDVIASAALVTLAVLVPLSLLNEVLVNIRETDGFPTVTSDVVTETTVVGVPSMVNVSVAITVDESLAGVIS